jgi:hypothetical protein
MSHVGSKARKIGSDEAANAIEERLRLIIDTIPTIAWSKLPKVSELSVIRFLNSPCDCFGLSLIQFLVRQL